MVTQVDASQDGDHQLVPPFVKRPNPPLALPEDAACPAFWRFLPHPQLPLRVWSWEDRATPEFTRRSCAICKSQSHCHNTGTVGSFCNYPIELLRGVNDGIWVKD